MLIHRNVFLFLFACCALEGTRRKLNSKTNLLNWKLKTGGEDGEHEKCYAERESIYRRATPLAFLEHKDDDDEFWSWNFLLLWEREFHHAAREKLMFCHIFYGASSGKGKFFKLWWITAEMGLLMPIIHQSGGSKQSLRQKNERDAVFAISSRICLSLTDTSRWFSKLLSKGK